MLPHRFWAPSAALPALIPATLFVAAALCLAIPARPAPAPKKPHAVALGTPRSVPYSKAGDPAGAGPSETTLKTRPLVVDGRITEWTTGDAHEVTDRSFVVRRALRINDTLPSDPASPAKPASAHWVWQRGPWLLVDKLTGRVTALKLSDYDPAVSQVAWFRDFGAYCGVTPAGKSLYAVVTQLATRKPVLAKKLASFDPSDHPWPICGLPEWQREPLRVTFHPNRGEAGQDTISFDVLGSSTKLVEEGDDEADPPEKPQ